MHYFVTIVYNAKSGKAEGKAMNLFGTAISSNSVLVSKKVLRCQRDDWTCNVFLGRQMISYNKGVKSSK